MNLRRHILNGTLWTATAWVLVEVAERNPLVLLLIPVAALFSWLDSKPDRELEGLSDGPPA